MARDTSDCVVCGEDTGILGVLCQDCYNKGYRLCLRCDRGYKPPDSRTNVCPSCGDDLREQAKYCQADEISILLPVDDIAW